VAALTIADHYDAELRWHNERFRAATGIGVAERVLDVGCGAGQTTRDAARAAVSGSVLGVDISERLLDRARRLTGEAGLHNVTYELADAQIHRFQSASFDVVISRFGTMFFADPVIAFTNLAYASRPGARLVMMVWQSPERNEWETAISQALTIAGHVVRSAPAQKAFSLGDPTAVKAILDEAGFSDVGFIDVNEPVYYGPDVNTAFDIICSFQHTKDILATLDAEAAERALEQLREMLAKHTTQDGVLFDSRSWIITARRAQRGLPRGVL
jgi:ubiquinone/menaquinone biosynthesis C-methylase UbiE